MLQHLALRNFRNFEHLDIAFPDAGIAIVGENGHGKTNLLEAVSYLALFRSIRGAKDSDAVLFGAPAFHVRAGLALPARFSTVSVGYERATKRKRATLDGVDQERLSLAFGALPSVCFSPADVALVAGGPAERRHFLDVALALSVAGYLPALQQYRSALRQRSAALRVAQRGGGRVTAAHEASVAVWEPSLSRAGGVLASSRRTWCATHAAEFSVMCAAIGERAGVKLRYAGTDGRSPHEGVTSAADSERADAAIAAAGDVAGREGDAPTPQASEVARAYQSAFDEQRGNELRRGITLVGPHRDDMSLTLGARDLRTFGSAGQQRTAAIALRMLELSSLRKAIGATPLLLLDDPFAELDTNRSARILSLLEERGVGQVLLAVPREEDIPRTFTRLERRAMVNGALR
ncbi:MAG: DNA replication and repair protein RecF [Phycisphaerae bacterium]|nr:DNA replication and repair protein RecF [Gemmatimonadaceae bacterium]